MPIALHQSSHALARLRSEGYDALTFEEASSSSLPEVNVGFLNMMPDAAVRATERQFYRLLASGAGDSCVVHVRAFAAERQPRSEEVSKYMQSCYESFAAVKSGSIDALVLSGANPEQDDLADEPFWDSFCEVIDWAGNDVRSTFCSCLATHAVLERFHGIVRKRCEPGKRWGMYAHYRTDGGHPLVAGINDEFSAARSHVHEIVGAQLRETDIEILATSDDADFHLAVSGDGLQWVYLQGHPEYDAISLLKEYKRDLTLFANGERDGYPPCPNNYFPPAACDLLERYRARLEKALDNGGELPEFPESQLAPTVAGTKDDHGVALFRNWLQAIRACKD